MSGTQSTGNLQDVYVEVGHFTTILLCVQITINVPLTKSTRGMIDAEAIGKMKKGAYLVRMLSPNTGSGVLYVVREWVSGMQRGVCRCTAFLQHGCAASMVLLVSTCRA